jgi:hypothetical protein
MGAQPRGSGTGARRRRNASTAVPRALYANAAKAQGLAASLLAGSARSWRMPRPQKITFCVSGRIFIELINSAFLEAGGTPDQFRAALARAIALGWLSRHESGTYVRFTEAGADLFA